MSERDEPYTGNESRTESPDGTNPALQRKLAVHERDRNTCICCRESFEELSHLDADHIVARGAGGADTIRNQSSLCRRCHEAKHGERAHGPTIRWTSTGDMIDKDFMWFRHFWTEVLPALSEIAADHRIEPRFNLTTDKPYQAWHLPMGDLRRLDENLQKEDEYAGMKFHTYM